LTKIPIFDSLKGWYRARVLRTLPGTIRKDEFGNLQKNIRLIDTGEILQELEKDLQPLDDEFNEENVPIGCCSIQIVGMVPNVEDGNFSQESRHSCENFSCFSNFYNIFLSKKGRISKTKFVSIK